jgi:hypothetical protein
MSVLGFALLLLLASPFIAIVALLLIKFYDRAVLIVHLKEEPILRYRSAQEDYEKRKKKFEQDVVLYEAWVLATKRDYLVLAGWMDRGAEVCGTPKPYGLPGRGNSRVRR